MSRRSSQPPAESQCGPALFGESHAQTQGPINASLPQRSSGESSSEKRGSNEQQVRDRRTSGLIFGKTPNLVEVRTSEAISSGQIVSLAETDIAIQKAAAILNAVSLVRNDPQVPLFPGEDVLMDVRAKELEYTMAETRETLSAAVKTLSEPVKPASTGSKIASKLFPHHSHQSKVDSRIESAKILAQNLEDKSEALLVRIEAVSK